jgi:hypothetical protein
MKLDFLVFKKSIDTLVANLRDVRNRIELLRREREELASAPATRDDVIAILHRRIDSAAAGYLKNFTETALDPIVRKAHRGDYDQYNHPIIAAPAVGNAPSFANLEAGIFFMFKDTVKAAVADAVRRAEWPVGAVALTERAGRLQQLDDEISKLESEESELSRYASEAGVIVSS